MNGSFFKIEIWAPRYMDQTVLIAKHKVHENNLIQFTKAKHLEGIRYFVSGETVRSSPLETNGKIACYAVPMSKLEVIG